MTNTKDKQAHQRKDAHLDLAKQPAAQAQIPHPLDDIRLTHHALPDTVLDTIDLSTRFLGHLCDAPFFIGAMTGGTDRADRINQALAEVAQSHNIALALGSQRAGLSIGKSQAHLRKIAPHIPLIGNLGITQLASKDGMSLAQKAIDDIEATAIAIHLNPLQEAAQIEGDHDWRNCKSALSDFIAAAPVPVMVKEVGAGISASCAAELNSMGAAYIDIAGLGGTNWTRIETARYDDKGLFDPFLDWGIPLPDALRDVRATLPYAKLIASGGIRHGLDVAKSLAIGADMVCAAGPFLKALEPSSDAIDQNALSELITQWQTQIRLACFLTNSQTCRDLAKKHA